MSRLAVAVACVALALGARASAQDEDVTIEVEAEPEVAPAPLPDEPADAPSEPVPTEPSAPPATPTDAIDPAATVTLPDAEPTTPEPTEVDPAQGTTTLQVERSWWQVLDVRVSGYVQLQLTFDQFSESEFAPDGTSMNFDRFFVRRGRVRFDRSFRYSHLALEIDASNTRAPFVGVRRAELSFFYPAADEGALPLVSITAGLTDVPFGFELRQSPRARWFLERSAGSLSFQRGEPDFGVRLGGALGVFRYAFAVMNGAPLDDRSGDAAVDFTRAKDLMGRLGIEGEAQERFRYRVGVSYTSGTGIHPGSPATKQSLVWRDLNEDGVVQTFEITGVAGRAASPSVEFHRWGLAVDLGLALRTRLGWTDLMAEATMATNLDRSNVIADPVASGYDYREVAWVVGITQELGAYAIVGGRVDYYDPDSDLLEDRSGASVATPTSQTTFTALVGGQLPGCARLILEYDRVRDHLGRTITGNATDLRNDRFQIRLQGEF